MNLRGHHFTTCTNETIVLGAYMCTLMDIDYFSGSPGAERGEENGPKAIRRRSGLPPGPRRARQPQTKATVPGCPE